MKVVKFYVIGILNHSETYRKLMLRYFLQRFYVSVRIAICGGTFWYVSIRPNNASACLDVLHISCCR